MYPRRTIKSGCGCARGWISSAIRGKKKKIFRVFWGVSWQGSSSAVPHHLGINTSLDLWRLWPSFLFLFWVLDLSRVMLVGYCKLGNKALTHMGSASQSNIRVVTYWECMQDFPVFPWRNPRAMGVWIHGNHGNHGILRVSCIGTYPVMYVGLQQSSPPQE